MEYQQQKKIAQGLTVAKLHAGMSDLKSRHTYLQGQVSDAKVRVRRSRALAVSDPAKSSLYDLHVNAALKDIEIAMSDIDDIVVSHWVMSEALHTKTQLALTL